MNRIDEITQACVKQILDNWKAWDQEAEMAATVAQDPEAWYDGMHAALWQPVQAAVEEAMGSELLTALEGVLRIADRRTIEFDAARAAIAKYKGGAK